MKKILIITYYWPPSGGPGVLRWLHLSKYLRNHGIEPIILTVDESKASYPLTDHSLLQEVPEDIKVFRTRSFEPLKFYTAMIPGSHLPAPGFSDNKSVSFGQKLSRFIRGNFFIPDVRIGWNCFAIRKARKIIQNEKPAAFITTSPPHSTQLVGLSIKKHVTIPWIADLRDPWTDIYYNRDLYRTRWASAIDAWYERRVLEKADHVLTVSESLKSLFLNKSMKLKAESISVTPNGYNPADFTQVDAPASTGNFTVTYFGTLSDHYPVKPFITACELLAQSAESSISVRIIGKATEDIKRQFLSSQVKDSVIFLPYQSHDEVVKAMKHTDILLLIIPDSFNNQGIVTGKLFEYLATKRPVLGFGPVHGDAAYIIRRCEAGEVFGYEQATEAHRWLLDKYMEWKEKRTLSAGNQHVEDYDRSQQAGMIAGIIAKVLHRNLG